MEFLAFLKILADKVFTEAGLVAGLLFVWSIYLIRENKGWRKENKELHDKIYDMGMRQIEVNAEGNNVLDKIADTLDKVITSKKAISQKEE